MMTVYVKELKEAFYSGGEASPYRTRQNVVGYFLDEESCWKDAEAERDFYYTRGYNTDLFSNGKTIYMNTTVEGRGDYTKMTYSWNPIRLLEVNHRGLSAEEFGAEGINLRKRIEDLIDLREVNFTGFKKDTKREAVKRARRIENELKGVLPKSKVYKVDKPKWFTIAQTGIVLGVAGLLGYSGFKGKE